jgi:hypothetical protein
MEKQTEMEKKKNNNKMHRLIMLGHLIISIPSSLFINFFFIFQVGVKTKGQSEQLS